MLDHVSALVLSVRDVTTCSAFYRDVMGFHYDGGDAREAYFTIGGPSGMALALLSAEALDQLVPGGRFRPATAPARATYFAIFVIDARREYERLRSKGARFVTELVTRPDGWQDAFFEDPEGNVWEIAQKPKDWPPAPAATS